MLDAEGLLSEIINELCSLEKGVAYSFKILTPKLQEQIRKYGVSPEIFNGPFAEFYEFLLARVSEGFRDLYEMPKPTRNKTNL